jgi:hypothetical protein
MRKPNKRTQKIYEDIQNGLTKDQLIEKYKLSKKTIERHIRNYNKKDEIIETKNEVKPKNIEFIETKNEVIEDLKNDLKIFETEEIIEPEKIEPKTEEIIEPKTEPIIEPKTEPIIEPKTEPIIEPKTERKNEFIMDSIFVKTPMQNINESSEINLNENKTESNIDERFLNEDVTPIAETLTTFYIESGTVVEFCVNEYSENGFVNGFQRELLKSRDLILNEFILLLKGYQIENPELYMKFRKCSRHDIMLLLIYGQKFMLSYKNIEKIKNAKSIDELFKRTPTNSENL